MKTTHERATAKIYTFPAGGRTGVGRSFEETKSAAEMRVPMPYADLSGSGWYHAAAILDADGTHKH